jgi:glycosyltransferase involved in cell wall biosynthesis
MAEVAGNAAVLVDPYDTKQIVEAIFKAMAGRDKFVKKGIVRAERFSWRKTAEKTLAVYVESLN